MDLLANGFTVRELAFALYDTLVLHWAGRMAGRGGVRRDWRRRPGSGAAAARSMVIIVAFAPYAVFHLLFQETVTTRYALPLVPPAGLPARYEACSPAPVVGLAAVAAVLALLFCVHDRAGDGDVLPRRAAR